MTDDELLALCDEVMACDDVTVMEWALTAQDLADALRAKLAELAALRERCNDTDLDCTDAACPAWWRGNDAGVMGACQRVNEMLDGKHADGGTFGGDELNRLRDRINALRARLPQRIERPTKPGWYWWRRGRSWPWHLINIHRWPTGCLVTNCSRHEEYIDEFQRPCRNADGVVMIDDVNGGQWFTCPSPPAEGGLNDV